MAHPQPQDDVKVSYLHGRPGPHLLHGRFAEAVGGEFQFVDFRMRWQDQDRSRPYIVASWLLCAATLPKRTQYDVFLVDNLHVGPVLMKLLFLRKDQRIVVHLGSHTMYFLYSHRFSRLVEKLHLWALRRYDALICEGKMAADMARELLGDRCPPTYETFLGPPAERSRALAGVKPDLDGRMILLVASGPGDFRMHYKGLDLMVDAVARVIQREPTVEFNILGAWHEDIVDLCMSRLPSEARGRVHFRGRVDDVEEWFRRAALYLHVSRGDAFPTASVEAMAAGLVPLVSEWTGTRQIVEKVEERLVVPLNVEEVADRIHWYFDLPSGERAGLSSRCREVSRAYTEESARAHYRETFQRLCTDLGIGAGA